MSRCVFKAGTISLGALLFLSCATLNPENRTIRVAVIGGLDRTGLWAELAKRFEDQSGCHAELVLSGNRDRVAEAFRAGKVDLALMHAGDVASKLRSEGYARNMRPFARNEFVILGPRSDPARIRGLRDGAAALARIARAEAPFVNYQNSGPRDIASGLWEKAGIRPQGRWILEDDSDSSEEVLEFARKMRAYLILGRMPSQRNTGAADEIEILVQGDPHMHRLFVVLEADPRKIPQANSKGARRLARFLLSATAHDYLFAFAENTPVGLPLFYPVKQR